MKEQSHPQEGAKPLYLNGHTLDEIWGVYNSWPLPDVLAKLVDATDYLLHNKNYDGHGWEEVQKCVDRGREILALLSHPETPIQQPEQPDAEELFNQRNSELAERIEIAMEQNMSPIEMATYLQSFEPDQPVKKSLYELYASQSQPVQPVKEDDAVKEEVYKAASEMEFYEFQDWLTEQGYSLTKK